MGAKRRLINGTSKVNRQTDRRTDKQTDRQTDISTYRKHRSRRPMLRKEKKQITSNWFNTKTVFIIFKAHLFLFYLNSVHDCVPGTPPWGPYTRGASTWQDSPNLSLPNSWPTLALRWTGQLVQLQLLEPQVVEFRREALEKYLQSLAGLQPPPHQVMKHIVYKVVHKN